MTFQELKLDTSLLQAISELNYTQPTTIQQKAIPLVLQGKDVLGSAQTGTGKTAAFALPIVHHLIHEKASNKRVRALVVTPTRELALQISENFTAYSKHTSIRNNVIFGGVKQAAQLRALKQGGAILVATPGRLLDLMNQGFISLKEVGYFVLDEADRMLDMGFINDINKIIKELPNRKQSLFFSATLPDKIVKLSNTILHEPKKVSANVVSTTAETIQQHIYYTNKNLKKDLLLHILKDDTIEQALVFSRTKHGADKIVRNLKKKHIDAAAIHGNKTQVQRQKALKAFKNKKIRILVASDIAARGIDIDKLTHVINYDVPNEAETYVHRIGRCGRAGKQGVAISLCEPEENSFVKSIEKLIKKKIEVISNHDYAQTDKPMNAQEKKAFEKEKQRRKQEFFANRKKKRR